MSKYVIASRCEDGTIFAMLHNGRIHSWSEDREDATEVTVAQGTAAVAACREAIEAGKHFSLWRFWLSNGNPDELVEL